MWVYEVENRTALKSVILPFFKNSPFLSKKKKADFARFQKIVTILERNPSKTFSDLQEILLLLDEIESKSKRKSTNQEILDRGFQFWEKNQTKILALNQKIKNPQRLQAKRS